MAGSSRQKLTEFDTKLAYIPAKYHYNIKTELVSAVFPTQSSMYDTAVKRQTHFAGLGSG